MDGQPPGAEQDITALRGRSVAVAAAPLGGAEISDEPLEYVEVFCPPKDENDVRGGLPRGRPDAQ